MYGIYKYTDCIIASLSMEYQAFFPIICSSFQIFFAKTAICCFESKIMAFWEAHYDNLSPDRRTVMPPNVGSDAYAWGSHVIPRSASDVGI